MRVRNTTVTAAVAGVLTAGLLTTTSLIAAPAGNASCISVWGIGNNDQCQSVPTSVAIALGKASVAQAFGLYSIAIANGLGLPDPGKPEEHNSAFATT